MDGTQGCDRIDGIWRWRIGQVTGFLSDEALNKAVTRGGGDLVV